VRTVYTMIRFSLQWLALSVVVLNGAGLPTGAHALTAGQSGTLRQILDGEQLFRSYCAACHGADGKGHGPAASALKTPPADLTLIAKRNAGTFPRDQVVRYVANGDSPVTAHGSRDMPVWGPNLAALAPGSYKSINERIEAVVSYLNSIQMTN
jgi:mono/diheme cytochrome c family protein